METFAQRSTPTKIWFFSFFKRQQAPVRKNQRINWITAPPIQHSSMLIRLTQPIFRKWAKYWWRCNRFCSRELFRFFMKFREIWLMLEKGHFNCWNFTPIQFDFNEFILTNECNWQRSFRTWKCIDMKCFRQGICDLKSEAICFLFLFYLRK